jgi:hypothetical protein
VAHAAALAALFVGEYAGMQMTVEGWTTPGYCITARNG